MLTFIFSIGRLSATVWVEGAQAKEKWYLTAACAQKNDTYIFITKRCRHLANVFHVFRIVLHVFRQKYSV